MIYANNRSNMKVEIGNVDWKLLREQKFQLCLLEKKCKKQRDVIDGILSLLDAIQDSAAETVGNENVFGFYE